MTRIHDEATTRAVSRDGTEIACWVSGEGPPLVLVHGTTADHTRWRPLLPHIESHVTVYAMDRRGRGGSGDGPRYDVAREFEDVAAVVDAVAALSGTDVAVFGHSYGAFCALGAARQTGNLSRLVLYEPPLVPEADITPAAVTERLEQLLAVGDAEGVVATFFREVVGMDDAQLEGFRALPAWKARVAAAGTLPREFSADLRGALSPSELADIGVPTLMLLGGNTPDWLRRDTETVAATLPDVRVAVLDGQEHIAIDLVPETVAEHVLGFVFEER